MDDARSESRSGGSPTVEHQLSVLQSKIDGLVPHVLQLENAAILIIGLMVLLRVIDTLADAHPSAEIAGLYWFLPYAALFLVGRLIKIRNPYNRIADVIETGFNYAGAGALAGGSATGLASGGLGAPAGAAIGGTAGFVIGIGVGVVKTRGRSAASEHTCPGCSARVEASDRFCAACGRRQVWHRGKCPECSRPVSEHSRFCPDCGRDLSQTAVAETDHDATASDS